MRTGERTDHSKLEARTLTERRPRGTQCRLIALRGMIVRVIANRTA